MENSISHVWLSLGQVDELLADMNGISDDQRSAFTGRIKMLSRLGVPPAAKVGTGRRAQLDFDGLWQMALAVELIQLSLSTERAANLVLFAWPRGVRDVMRMTASWADLLDPIVIILALEGYDGVNRQIELEELERRRMAAAVGQVYTPLAGFGAFSKAFRHDGPYQLSDPERFRRLSIVNASGLATRLAQGLEERGWASQFEFKEWCRAQPPIQPRLNPKD